MRKGIGITCILLGLLCLLSAAGFAVYNQWDAKRSAESSQELLYEVRKSMEELQQPGNIQEDTVPESIPEHTQEADDREMPTVSVDGYASIGILSIPVLELDLPVLTQWSYEKLKKAPCQYHGSYYDRDFVIAAHNYPSHFGRLSELQPKDLILFTDTEGTEYCYEVVLTETLPPTATEEMITSGFDLSLYTCTPGGGNRVTVRCRRI